jgi:aminopeptidase YwaD
VGEHEVRRKGCAVKRTEAVVLGRGRVTVVACILVVLLTTTGSVLGQPGIPSELLRQVNGPRAYQHVLALSQRIGPHVAGTPEDRTSAAYIARQLENDGFGVEWQAFQFPYFGVRAVGLTLPSHSTLTLHPHAMLYSPSSPPGGITADLVDVGIGRPEDVRGKPLAGKIALILRGTLPFREKAMNAAQAGAVAAIIYNSRPEEFGGLVGHDTKIPVVSLPGTEGLQLADLARSGPVTAHLKIETVNETRTTWNIIGTKPAVKDSHRVLVVGAHRDTVDNAPGANDNTSGVAVALEVAEVLRRTPLAATVRFVFFGAEEMGLYGSDYYVHHMGSDPVIGMVNLDMEGVGERLELATYQGTDSLVRVAARLADALGIKVEVARSPGSDHMNFERAGVPVVFLFRPDDLYYDTPKDTVDRVDPKLLETSGRLAAAVVLTVAGAGQ